MKIDKDVKFGQGQWDIIDQFLILILVKNLNSKKEFVSLKVIAMYKRFLIGLAFIGSLIMIFLKGKQTGIAEKENEQLKKDKKTNDKLQKIRKDSSKLSRADKLRELFK